MSVLVTFPGKFGDLLWAMPTVRALSRRMQEPVQLLIAEQFGGLAPVLREQEYIQRVTVDPDWKVQDTAPISPRIPPEHGQNVAFDRVLHLGYRGWPDPDVVMHTRDTANAQLWPDPIQVRDLALDASWIQYPRSFELAETHRCDLAIAFTDEHFELKLGVAMLVVQRLGLEPNRVKVIFPPGSRWDKEVPHSGALFGGALDWRGYASIVNDARVVLADCSAAHVLAVAMGKPVVLMEPNEHRWNQVFYPLGKTGPQVTLVLGGDGHPTWDSRHTAETVLQVLEQEKTNADR